MTESELEELLDAERDIEAPPEDARSRMFARLAPIMIPAVIGAGVAGSSGAGTALSGNATGVVGSSLKVKLLIAAIAGAVGAIGGATTHAALTRAREKGTAAASVSAIGRSEPPAPVRSEPSPQPSEVTDAPAEATPSTSAPTRAAGNGPATLLNERLLLERASAALMRGDSSAALQALREHARRFPRGELAEERQVLMIRALRAAGQDEAAEKVSKDFKSKFPSSLDQGTIEETPSSK